MCLCVAVVVVSFYFVFWGACFYCGAGVVAFTYFGLVLVVFMLLRFDCLGVVGGCGVCLRVGFGLISLLGGLLFCTAGF